MGFRVSWEWIKPYVRERKWMFALGFLLMMVENALLLGAPGVQKWIIDDVFLKWDFSRLPLYLVILGVSLIAVIRKERTARYTDFLVKDVYSICEQVSYKMPRALQRLALALVLIGIIGAIYFPLLVIVLALMIAYIALGRHYGAKIRTMSRSVQDERTGLAVFLEEGVASSREVIAYHRTDWELKRFGKLFQPYYKTVMKEGKLENRSLLIGDPIKWGAIVAVLFVGAYLVMRNIISAGTLIVLYYYTSMLMDACRETYTNLLRYAKTVANIDRIRTVTDAEKVGAGHVRLQEPIRSIEWDRVSFAYPGQEENVLEELTFSVPVGKKVAIVGASGGGKSTIAHLMVRFAEPTSGVIRINGVSLQELDRADWSKKVAVTFQEPYLFPDSIQDNVTFGRPSSKEEVLAMCSRMKLDDMLDTLPEGLDTEVGERGIQLSGGQRQRLALARAVLADPELLILDEATSALDLETERRIQRFLDERRRGRTTVIIAHRLSTVRNADWILVIENGRLAEQGTHEDLMRNRAVYSRLVAAQSEEAV